MSLLPELKKIFLGSVSRREVRAQVPDLSKPLAETSNRSAALVRLPDVDLCNYFAILIRTEGGLTESRFSLTNEQIVRADESGDPAGFLASTVEQISARERREIKKWTHDNDGRLQSSQIPQTGDVRVSTMEQTPQQQSEIRRIKLFGGDETQLERERGDLRKIFERGFRGDKYWVTTAMEAITKLHGVSAADFFGDINRYGVKRLVNSICNAKYELKVGDKGRIYFNILNGGSVIVTGAGLRGNQKADGGKKSSES